MLLLSLTLSCSADRTYLNEETDTGDALMAISVYTPVIQNGEGTTQLLTEGCEQFDLIDDYRYLCLEGGNLSMTDESTGEIINLTEASHAAGAYVDGKTWLAIDGLLYQYGDELSSVEVDLPVPIERLYAKDETLWLWGLNRLFRLKSGVLNEFALSDNLEIYDFSVNDTRLWLSTPWLIEVDITSEPYQVLYQSTQPINNLQVDLEGAVWWISDGQLARQTPSTEVGQHGLYSEVLLPSAPSALSGPDLWIHTAQESYHFRDGQFYAFEQIYSEDAQIDIHGRVTQIEGDNLIRYSSHRPVVVVGLPSELTTQQSIQLLPSAPESLSGMRVWIDSTELELGTVPWRVTLDPETISPGLHEFRFWCESSLGDEIDTHPVWVGELPDVSWDDILEISEAHCLSCHSGATLTDLSEKSDWEYYIDSIIQQISTEGMPLGGPYLNDTQITTIRAWKAGGFQ